MYQRELAWEKYLERYGFKDDLSNGLQRKGQPPVRLASFAALIASVSELDFLVQHSLVSLVIPIDTRTISPEGLRSSFDWSMGSVLWKLEIQRPGLQDIAGRSGSEAVTSAVRHKAEAAYQSGAYPEALAGFEACASKDHDFPLYITLGHLYLYHRHPAELDKARKAYLQAVDEAAPHAPLYAGRALLWAAFVAYLQHDDHAGFDMAQRALILVPQMAEAWYTLARFASALDLPNQAIPTLEQAIRADRNYALRAAADADMSLFNIEITALLEKLRLDARQKVDIQGRTMALEIQQRTIPTAEVPNSQRMQAEITERWKQDTFFGYLDASSKMLHYKVYLDGLHLAERDQLTAEGDEMLARLAESMAPARLPTGVQESLQSLISDSHETLANSPTLEQAQTVKEKIRQAQALWRRASSQSVLTGHTAEVNLLAFQPGGSLLVSSGSWDKSLLLWDTLNSETHAILNGHLDIINALAFSSDGKWLASAGGHYKGQDFAVRIWDTAKGQSQAVMDWHTNQVTTLAFDPQNQRLASGSADWRICIWSVPDGQKLDVLEGQQGAVTCLAFSPDGRLLVSGGEDGAIRLWDLTSANQVGVLLGHQAKVQAVLLTPDGNTLISAGDDQTLRTWDFIAHHLRAVYEQPAKITAVALSPDGKRLAWALGEDGMLRLCGVDEGSAPLELPGHTGKINCLAFNAEGQLLASGGEDGRVRLWDALSGQGKAIRSGHDQPVTCLAFSPDGCLVASGGKDKCVRLFGLALTPEDAAAIENEVEMRRQNIEQEQKEKEAAEERQRTLWHKEGRCEACGARLSWVERMGKQVRCKEHRL